MKCIYGAVSFVILFIVPNVTGSTESLAEKLKRTTIATKCYNWIRHTNLYRDFGQPASSGQYTLFCPHNNLIGIPPSLLLRMNQESSIQLRTTIFKYHSISLSVSKEDMLGSKNGYLRTRHSGAPKLFLRSFGQDLYVGGAKVLQSIKADNGWLHIVDKMLYPAGQTDNIYQFVEKQGQRTLRQSTNFFKLLEAYEGSTVPSSKRDASKAINGEFDENNKQVIATMFVPVEMAFDTNRGGMSLRKFYELKESASLLEPAIESTVVPNEAIYTNMIDAYAKEYPKGIPAYEGSISFSRYGDDIYVENSCLKAKLLRDPTSEEPFHNVTLANGVVHLVDKMLGFKYADAFTKIKTDPQTSKASVFVQAFSETKGSSSGKVLQLLRRRDTDAISTMITMFVPTDTAIGKAERAGAYISQNDGRALNTSILSSILTEPLFVRQMTNTTKKVNMAGGTVTFTRIGTEVYMEANRVTAKITNGDVCVRNGVLHYVNEVPGVPYQSIYTLTTLDPTLTSFMSVTRTTGLSQELSSQQVTAFIANDAAFKDTRSGLSERLMNILDGNGRLSTQQKALFMTHVVEGEYYIPLKESDPAKVFESLKSLNPKAPMLAINLDPKTNSFYVTFADKRFNILRPNIRCTNGVAHIVDGVFIDQRSIEDYAAVIGSAPRTCYLCAASTLLPSLLVLQRLLT